MNSTNVTSIYTASAIQVTLYFVISLVGIFTNMINIIVLNSHGLKQKTFKYLLFVSICDLSYLIIFEVYFIFNITYITNTTYFGQWFKTNINDYLTSCLAMLVIFIDLLNSFDRYFILLNKNYLKNISYRKILFILSLISLALYFPEVCSNKVIMLNSSYTTIKNKFGRSRASSLLIKLVWALRIFLSSFLLTGINFLTILALYQRMKKRKMLKIG
jgi:hypothetical protein